MARARCLAVDGVVECRIKEFFNSTGRGPVNEFVDSLLIRVGQAEQAVRRAVEQQDEYGAEVHGADLANLRRLAAEHGVAVGAPEEG